MDLVHRNAMAVFEKKKIGKALYQVRVRLVNSKAVSSITYRSITEKIHPKDQLTISGKNIEVLAGGPLTDMYNNKVSYKEHRPELQFLQIPGFSKLEYQFIVKGKGDIVLEYKSVKAKDITSPLTPLE